MDAEYQFPTRVTISMRDIVGAVVRDCDLVAKLKIMKFFPGVFVGDLQEFMLVKISPLYGIV